LLVELAEVRKHAILLGPLLILAFLLLHLLVLLHA
jgi:hypothetical protein